MCGGCWRAHAEIDGKRVHPRFDLRAGLGPTTFRRADECPEISAVTGIDMEPDAKTPPACVLAMRDNLRKVIEGACLGRSQCCHHSEHALALIERTLEVRRQSARVDREIVTHWNLRESAPFRSAVAKAQKIERLGARVVSIRADEHEGRRLERAALQRKKAGQFLREPNLTERSHGPGCSPRPNVRHVPESMDLGFQWKIPKLPGSFREKLVFEFGAPCVVMCDRDSERQRPASQTPGQPQREEIADRAARAQMSSVDRPVVWLRTRSSSPAG